jgi:hypothetical protein
VRHTATIRGVLLTITTTREPATDLGYLLHKHPARAQLFRVSSSGTAHVFYPEASDKRCTAALLLEVDPVELVRGANGRGANGHGSNGHGSNNHADAITHYVNDRPYAASSLLAVALKDVFGTALTGRCDARPDLAAAPLPLEIHVPALRCGDGPQLAERVFGPLGWTVAAESLTAAGGEGMVVKPASGLVRGPKGIAQPGLKVRGRDYLRIVYGPDYTEPANLDRLRSRGVGRKRSLALREYALGLEALDRVARGEPPWRVHECVFGVLALESEPVDPRL